MDDSGDRPVGERLGNDDEGDRENEFGGTGAVTHPGRGLFDGLAGDGDRGLGLHDGTYGLRGLL